jgi:Cu+-exporting ATPase
MSHEHHHHGSGRSHPLERNAGIHSSHGGHEGHAETRQGLSPSGEGVIYTCPMHPQIRQVGPGNCPICGMKKQTKEKRKK